MSMPSGPQQSGRSLWTVCSQCQGEGKIKKQPSKKARMRHKRARMEQETPVPVPQPRWDACTQCQASGLVDAGTVSEIGVGLEKNNLPHVAIIGGGLGGLALAIACRHREIPFTVYERDSHFSQRSQGYGLTMQQASKALKSFGISRLEDGITSTKHVVHRPDGVVVGEWGLRKWGASKKKKSGNKRQNVHIARQSLRRQLLDALGGDAQVEWDSQLVDYVEDKDGVDFTIRRGGVETKRRADLLIGADGIRSAVRKLLVGDEKSPLSYLGCIVSLGICPRTNIQSDSPLLDGETVFQTADGTTRIYAMPYSPTEYMWQLSFPMQEDAARLLSQQGASALKQEAISKCGTWHDPVPQLLTATPESLVSGYPVYDRALLTREQLPLSSRVTLLGDAAHPMSPFKGQGANQALLDALSLARILYKIEDHKEALRQYEDEMLSRSAAKVKASADAAEFLHSDVAIQEGNVTRGGAANRETSQTGFSS